MTERDLLQAMKVLLSLSLSGTLLFLFLYVLLPLYRNRCSRFWQYYIWLIVCARFLFPVTPAASVSGFLFHTVESAAGKAIGLVSNFTDDTVAPADSISSAGKDISENAGLSNKNVFKNAAGDLPNKNDFKDAAGDLSDKKVFKDAAGGQVDRNVLEDATGDPSDKNNLKNNVRSTADENSLKNAVKGTADKNSRKNVIFGLSLIWLVVALRILLCRIISYQHFCRSLKIRHTPVTDIETWNELSECMERLKIRRHIIICRNPSAVSPMTVGFFHPCIILPEKTIYREELSLIFMHELIHVKRHDLLYKWLAQAVFSIHWFNPFAHLLVKEVNKACELSCDEAVLNLLKNEKDKRAYGDMLLSFVRPDTALGNPHAPMMLTEGAEQLKERLGAIMNHKKKTKTITAASAVITAIACFWFTALGAYAASMPSADPESQTAQMQAELEPDWDIPQSSNAFTQSDYGNESDRMLMNLKNKKTGQEKYYYTNCQGFYCNSYLMELTWNINEPSVYADNAVVSLDDRTSMTVYFHEKAAKYAKDKKAIAAIGKAIVSAGTIYIDPVTRPAVLRMVYIPADKISAYTKKYFQNKDILGFAALFPALDDAAKQSYAAKAYKADDIAFFCITLDDLDDATMRQYAKKALEDERIDVLTLLLDEIKLTTEELRSYAKKAYAEDDLACFNVLADLLSKSMIRQYAKKSIQDGKVDFLSVLLDYVKPSASDLHRYAGIAYGQDDIACFRVLTDYMSSTEKRAWKKQAKKDGNFAFYHMIADK